MTAKPAGRLRRYAGIGIKLAMFVVLLFVAREMSEWAMARLSPHLTPSTEPALHRTIMIAIAIYVVLMMLPFVPGVEIGIGMMMMFGPKIAPLVYCGTVLALVLAFLFGRLLPQDRIIGLLETVRLKRAGRLLRQMASLDSRERLQFLVRNASTGIVPFLLRNRFLALMVALNLPGNAIIGGGGGICLLAGFSRLFAFPGFLLAAAIAVAPVPLFLLLSGG